MDATASYHVDLDDHQCHHVYEQIQRNFSDFSVFHERLSTQAMEVIFNARYCAISPASTKKLEEIALASCNLISHPTKDKDFRDLVKEHTIILKACYVLILALQSYIYPLQMTSISELIHDYPQFSSLDREELNRLLIFRNMMRVALLIIPAKGHKQVLLKIAGRLEGSLKDYITGGGQTKETCRRVAIYEREGGVHASRKLSVGVAPHVSESPERRKRKIPNATNTYEFSSAKKKNCLTPSSLLCTPQPAASMSEHLPLKIEAPLSPLVIMDSTSFVVEDDNWNFEFEDPLLSPKSLNLCCKYEWASGDETTVASVDSECASGSHAFSFLDKDENDELLDLLTFIREDTEWMQDCESGSSSNLGCEPNAHSVNA